MLAGFGKSPDPTKKQWHFHDGGIPEGRGDGPPRRGGAGGGGGGGDVPSCGVTPPPAGGRLPGDTRPAIRAGSRVLNHLPLTVAAALLDEGDAAFVFFAEPGTDGGQVLYRRFDGHYGLITSAV